MYDNGAIVRAWSIEKAKLLDQWFLPHVEGGFSKQWEGMAFQRRQCAHAQLRGSHEECSPSLMLYLTLDSPPRVWSLVVEKSDSNASLVFPHCAAAYNTSTGK
jgi:hypothetical protein